MHPTRSTTTPKQGPATPSAQPPTHADKARALPSNRGAGQPAPTLRADDATPNPTANELGLTKAWTPRSKATYLTRGANGTWYFRLVVPAHLRAQNPTLPRELKRSTKTADRRLALARSREMCLDFFTRSGTSERKMLALGEKKSQSFSIVYVDGSIRVESSGAASAETLLLMSRCQQLLISQLIARSDRARGTTDTQPLAALVEPPAATEALATIALPVQSQQAPTSPRTASTHATGTDAIWLSDAIDEWLVNGGVKFSPQSWADSYQPSFRVLRELIGETRRDRELPDGTIKPGMLDIDVRSIAREHIRAFHCGLKALPPRQGQRDDGMEATERICAAAGKKLRAPSKDAVSKRLTHVRPFFTFAKRKGWLSEEVIDEMELAVKAADADLLRVKQSLNKKAGAVALTEIELKKMFEQPAFLRGAIQTPWKYWGPLLCLYHGLRVSEASQLFTNDIVKIDGVDCLSVISDTSSDENEPQETASRTRRTSAKNAAEFRRVKNAASRRTVPIHPELIKLGFLDFVGEVDFELSEPRHLFGDLRWEPKSMFGRQPSEYMRELIKKAGICDPRRKVPHSLRSNFKQSLEKTLLSDNLQKRLLGHSTHSIKDRHYNETDAGPAFPVNEVLPFLCRMDFNLKLPKWSEVCAARAYARSARISRSKAPER